jgi:hypothetical protein
MPTANASVTGVVDAGCNVENTIPVLAVSDMQVSIRFYRDLLGFKLDWGGENDSSQIASVSRDGHAVMLQRREPQFSRNSFQITAFMVSLQTSSRSTRPVLRWR